MMEQEANYVVVLPCLASLGCCGMKHYACYPFYCIVCLPWIAVSQAAACRRQLDNISDAFSSGIHDHDIGGTIEDVFERSPVQKITALDSSVSLTRCQRTNYLPHDFVGARALREFFETLSCSLRVRYGS